MATFTEKSLGQATIASGSNTTLYTVPAATTGIVKDIHICNVTATAADITVWVDVDGTAATDSEAIIKEWSVPANEFLHWDGYIIMSAASTIKATAGTGSAITVTVSGAEIS